VEQIDMSDITKERHAELVRTVLILAKTAKSLRPIERAAIAMMTDEERQNPIRDDRALEIACDAALIVGRPHLT
jgi:hypothetical protein